MTAKIAGGFLLGANGAALRARDPSAFARCTAIAARRRKSGLLPSPEKGAASPLPLGDPTQYTRLLEQADEEAANAPTGSALVFCGEVTHGASFGPRGHDYRHPSRVPWRERLVGSMRRAVARAWRSACG